MLAYDIASDFRTEIDDTDTADPLWSDAEVIRYMNLAINEVAKKTLCIADATTASIFQLTVTQDDAWVPYSSLILEFDPQTAYSQGQTKNLPIMGKYEFLRARTEDDYGVRTPTVDWQSETGTPKLFISDIRTEYLRAYPVPTAADTLEVFAKRLPLTSEKITDIAVTSIEVPAVPEMFHEDLVVFMMHRAYLKNDAECYDKGLSDKWLAMWSLEVLPEMRRLLKRRKNRKAAVARYRPNG